jgi:hypothetical protein
MFATLSQHPWLLGILCGSPIFALLIIRLWSAFGASASENSRNVSALLYWCGLIVLAGGMGVLLTQGAAVLLTQSLIIPRALVIICCLPIIGLFASSIFNKVGGVPAGQTIYEWIFFSVCLICLPGIITLIWRHFGTAFIISEIFTVPISELARFYLPVFVLFWTPIFCFLNVFAYGMGGEMLGPSSTILESISMTIKPLSQYESCVLISLRCSLGLTALVLVLCETFRMIALVITR